MVFAREFRTEERRHRRRRGRPSRTRKVLSGVGRRRVRNPPRWTAIKISRGEENIFIWCFFLAIVELALDDGAGTGPYNWVEYMSTSTIRSHRSTSITPSPWANHLVEAATERPDSRLKTVDLDAPHAVLSTCFALRAAEPSEPAVASTFSSRDGSNGGASSLLSETGDTPSVPPCGRVSSELWLVAQSGHGQVVHPSFQHAPRTTLEKTASFPRLQELLRVHQEGR